MHFDLIWASKKNHIDAIAALLKDAFRENHGRMPSEKFMKRLYWRLGQAITGQGDKDSGFDPAKERVRIAIDEEKSVLGVVWWSRYPAETDEPRAYVRALAVKEPYRRQGIGTALVDEMAQFCDERAIQFLDASVYFRNTGVFEFAKALGFKPEKVWMKRKCLPTSQLKVDTGDKPSEES